MESRASLRLNVLCVGLSLFVIANGKKNPSVGANQPEDLLFHFSTNFPPFSFLENEPQPSTLTGFGVLFARALCDKFGLSCEFIRLEAEECWKANDYPGSGVATGTYVCSTYSHTNLRATGLDVGHAYVQRRPSGILTRLDKNGRPAIFPGQNDLKGAKIAAVGGWEPSGASLASQPNGCTGKLFSNFEVVTPADPFTGPDTAMKMLLEGDVDGVYAHASLIDDRRDCDFDGCNPELYQHLGTSYAWIHTGMEYGQVNGTTLSMTAKGSAINSFLNPLIQEFLLSPEYASLCRDYDAESMLCFRNTHFQGAPKTPPGYLNDLARTQNCQDKKQVCNTCIPGYCICSKD